jgi:hypothetical protein
MRGKPRVACQNRTMSTRCSLPLSR